MLITPGGTPASCARAAKRSAVSGASSEVLSTSVQPVASTGPIFQTSAHIGPFQGTMAPTTPTGSSWVWLVTSNGSEFGIVSPLSPVACPA